MNKEALLTGERWNYNAKGYSNNNRQEFMEKEEEWTQLLLEKAPSTGKKSLDVGTGPGFFALLLAKNGFDSSGVDCSEKMIEQAEDNSREYDLTVDFHVMDSHELEFPDNCFDYIVSRNATWLLYDPEKAFTEWMRVLKPGGRLMYIDANWPYKDDPELLRKQDEAYRRFEEKQGGAFNSYTGTKALDEEFNRLVAFDHIWRPEWDMAKLPELGFQNVKAEPRINERVYPPWKQELYYMLDLFLITADKPKE